MNYTSDNRGRIQLRDRARQIVDFSGLRYGKITPTDLDGLIEYRDKAFVLYEYKYQNADMPPGQKLALTRLIDCLNKSKPSVLFLCRHEITDCKSDIPGDRIVVAKRYYRGKWKDGDGRTAREYTDTFLDWVDAQARGPFGDNFTQPPTYQAGGFFITQIR